MSTDAAHNRLMMQVAYDALQGTVTDDIRRDASYNHIAGERWEVESRVQRVLFASSRLFFVM